MNHLQGILPSLVSIGFMVGVTSWSSAQLFQVQMFQVQLSRENTAVFKSIQSSDIGSRMGSGMGGNSSHATAFVIDSSAHHSAKDESQIEQTKELQRIEQPFWIKAAVTGGGLGLIGLELWWFLFSQPKTQKAPRGGGLKTQDRRSR